MNRAQTIFEILLTKKKKENALSIIGRISKKINETKIFTRKSPRVSERREEEEEKKNNHLHSSIFHETTFSILAIETEN